MSTDEKKNTIDRLMDSPPAERTVYVHSKATQAAVHASLATLGALNSGNDKSIERGIDAMLQTGNLIENVMSIEEFDFITNTKAIDSLIEDRVKLWQSMTQAERNAYGVEFHRKAQEARLRLQAREAAGGN